MKSEGVERDDAELVVEIRSSIAIIRLNRPAQRNVLSIATLRELDAAVSKVASREDIARIIFTGTGDVFASGADIRDLMELTPASALTFAKSGQQLFQKIANARQVTIAAINGYCMGGGLDLALACDMRCAATEAVFAHPGARLGIITGWGGTQRLPRLIGTARALEIFVWARRVSSSEALGLGLVSSVGDPVLDCALVLANRAVPAREKQPLELS
ncbi:MAG: 3-hydroxypropionyl-coenzyme dehydratase [Acidobacteriota bacterium]|jgi:enoyl-CoA hydratase|nr:3-hydroxypropionyl-coenzyme dehydratase [Acidobacteriota bacterium]